MIFNKNSIHFSSVVTPPIALPLEETRLLSLSDDILPYLRGSAWFSCSENQEQVLFKSCLCNAFNKTTNGEASVSETLTAVENGVRAVLRRKHENEGGSYPARSFNNAEIANTSFTILSEILKARNTANPAP